MDVGHLLSWFTGGQAGLVRQLGRAARQGRQCRWGGGLQSMWAKAMSRMVVEEETRRLVRGDWEGTWQGRAATETILGAGEAHVLFPHSRGFWAPL